ncbi:MAG: AMP-binding protein [Desulfobacterota bacterium]|nr:AMP-binding protein [Thermodesulfobacteriota bacterium]
MDCIGTETLRTFLEFRARTYQEKECLVFENKDGHVIRYTYRQLDEYATRYAGLLFSKGIRHGDKVVVHLRNCPEFLFSWFGLAKIGAVMVPTNVLSTAPELEHFINYSDAVAVITEPDYATLVREVRPKCPKLRELFLVRTVSWYPTAQLFPDMTLLHDPGADIPQLPSIPLHTEDDALIIFSGNTLARNSAVLLTHANALFAGIFGAQAMKVVPEDRHFIVLPLFHVNGLFISCMPVLTAGATLIITEQFSASRYMEQVRRYEVTTSSLVGATVRMLLNQPPHELDSCNKLRLIAFAIPISDEEWERFEQRFHVRLCDLWGMTETLGATTINPIDGKFKRNCQGLPRLGNEVKIVDEQGHEQPPGTPGEIVVKGIPGRTIMKGYYKEPDTTQAVMRDGWLHTGDLGVMDEEGYFYFRGRIKDVIKRAGENVASPEVEQVLAQHPFVKEAAVVSMPDPVRDEAVAAFVVLHEGEECTAEQLIAWCSERLAKFKVPSRILFRNSLPRNADGTVRKDILRRELSAA